MNNNIKILSLILTVICCSQSFSSNNAHNSCHDNYLDEINIKYNDFYDDVNASIANISGMIHYGKEDRIDIKSWTKRANFVPINLQGAEYRKIAKFCYDNNLFDLQESINFLLQEIYNMASHIANTIGLNSPRRKVNEPHELRDYIQLLNKITVAEIVQEKRLLEIKTEQAMNLMDKKDSYPIKIIDSVNLMVPKMLFPIKTIDSFISKLQYNLNEKNYKSDKTNFSNVLETVSNNKYGTIQIWPIFLCIGNKLVQLTHDIIHNICNFIDNYEKNPQHNQQKLYDEFNKHLQKTTVMICTTLDAVFKCISIPDFIISNLCFIDNYKKYNEEKWDKYTWQYASNYPTAINLLKTYLLHWNRNVFEYLEYIKRGCIYYYSALGQKLFAQHQEMFSTFRAGISKIKEDIKNILNDLNNAQANEQSKFHSNTVEELKTLCKILSIIDLQYQYCDKAHDTLEDIKLVKNSITTGQTEQIAKLITNTRSVQYIFSYMESFFMESNGENISNDSLISDCKKAISYLSQDIKDFRDSLLNTDKLALLSEQPGETEQQRENREAIRKKIDDLIDTITKQYESMEIDKKKDYLSEIKKLGGQYNYSL